MSKEIYISSTPHETRLAIVENDDLTEIYYERENEYTLAGSIYNGKVTRVLPGMQSSFVDIGLERDAFLYITDFMEEAGDSAEFDSSDGANGSRRGSREERGGSRDGRSVREEAPIIQNEAASVPGVPPEVRSDRSDRDGGRRRRGNRDGRNGLRDGRGAEDRGGNRDRTAEIKTSAPDLVEPASETHGAIDSGYAEPEGAGAAADLGEGAPGADGSRRWRGRRGRRRGRSSVQREESQVLQQPPSAESESVNAPGQAYVTPSDESEENFDDEYADSFDVQATAASPASEQSVSEQSVSEQSVASGSPQDSASRSGDRDRGSRDRGDRGPRDRNRRDRDQRSPRAPRGFEPSRSLYGVESSGETDETGTGPAPEPIVLPGESLSKYRKNDGSTASSESLPSMPAPLPSTAFVLPGAWDGGNVLPGETIRPRSNTGGGSSEPSRPDRGGQDRGGQDRGGQDRGGRDRGSRGGRSDGRDRGNRNRPEFQAEAPSAYLPVQQQAPAGEAASPHPSEIAGTTSPQAPDPQAAPQLQQPSRPAVEEHADYEPVEGSASVRFDAAKVSEFRQSAPPVESHESSSAVETLVPAIDAGAEPETADPSQDAASHHAEPTAFSFTHTITPQPGEAFASIHTATEDVSPAHEFTAIQNSGEMFSEPLVATPEQEIAEPASPLHHESAVLEAMPSLQDVSVETPSGLLAEEHASTDESLDTSTLHASAIEEMDYDEDETLEGAADLGTMIREMSIDQITSPVADQEEDEDILEEEDTVDDHGSAAYDESDDMDEDEPRDFSESSEGAENDLSRSGFASRTQHDDDQQPAADGSGTEPETISRDVDRRHSRRDGGRRDGRRDGRGRDRGGDRARSTGGSGDRSTSRPGRRDGRHSAQVTNLPAISDLLKPGQEVLVQIAKEPIAKKGARITSHIALPGRFLVFMPTVNHTGVSRKIESDGERRRLKEILLSEKGEASGGFIVRTAASGASEEELRSDLRFLLNLWADIKQRSESSKSPALIYHDLNLVERVLRDQVTDTFSAIWVDTETEYERVLRFLQRFQPSLIRRVKLYTKETPLFEQFGITEEINKALRSKVWLKSGGSIVINQTEALVAIDINTGKYVGKTARLEDTIVKTNLDAIPEIVRQIRLRDLGGIIIIDFIDMDERKNRHKVMAALEEELKKDRAPSKVLQFNDFGLVAITRKRVKQSLERTLSATCNVCQGTGMTKSPVTVCNDIYIEIRKMQKHLDRGDVMLRVHPDVVKQLKAGGTKWLQEMEEIVGRTILVKSDPSLHPEQFDIH